MQTEVVTGQEEALRELDAVAPGVPLIALGQTVFWDEPMKAGVVRALNRIGSTREFVAGVHDTDYFAKFPSRLRKEGYEALPHNDTTTKDIWSAAGEFSALFGSETVITQKLLSESGARLSLVAQRDHGFLDQVTEAWGWRGVVSLSKEQQVTGGKKLSCVYPKLYETFKWALDASSEMVCGPNEAGAQKFKASVLETVASPIDPSSKDTLGDWYEQLLPIMYRLAGPDISVSTTRTSHLLRFNRSTVDLPRFDLLRLFLRPATAQKAREAYDASVHGTEMYKLERFGVGAIPFDLVIPGVGRGTLRLGTRGGLVMCDKPIGFSFKRPIECASDLAAVIEDKFGPDCVLVGKAVTLIGMLAREFVFVFHAGGSSYVTRSKQLHRALNHQVHPILRVTYKPWDALGECDAFIRLPQPLRRPFGTEEISAQAFASKWKAVGIQESQRLKDLALAKHTASLIDYLKLNLGGEWVGIAKEFGEMQKVLQALHDRTTECRGKRRSLVNQARSLNVQIDQLLKDKGIHWRTEIFEKNPDANQLARRAEFVAQEDKLRQEVRETWDQWRALRAQQDQHVSSPEISSLLKRRTEIALMAEKVRIELIRDALIATKGLEKAGHRPAAWWFRLTCPDGGWLDATLRTATYELEPLI